MKLVRIHGAREIKIDEVAMPVPGPRDVIVRVAACGICGSDIHFVRQGLRLANGDPMPLGHEATGSVHRVGAEAEGIVPGMRVFVNPVAHEDNVIGNGGGEGAFGEFLLVREAKLGTHLLLIPQPLTFAQAALTEPLAVGLHGVNRGNVDATTKAAVFGCGPIGLGAIMWLRRRGVAHVAAGDISETRLGFARKMGAHATINPRSEDLAARLAELHGNGIPVLGEATVGTDVFFDMAGGSSVIAGIVKIAQYHSRLVVTAVYPKPIEVDFLKLLMKEVEITTAGGYPTELAHVLAELPSIDPQILSDYVSHTLPFGEFHAGFEIARNSDSAKVMIEFDGRAA